MSGQAILVLDDDEGAAQALAQALERRGYSAVVTHTARDATAAALSPDIKLALLDIRLRGASGLSVLAALRAARPDVAVVMMSSDTEQATCDAALAQGAQAFLAKPLDLHALLAQVDDWMGRTHGDGRPRQD